MKFLKMCLFDSLLHTQNLELCSGAVNVCALQKYLLNKMINYLKVHWVKIVCANTDEVILRNPIFRGKKTFWVFLVLFTFSSLLQMPVNPPRHLGRVYTEGVRFHYSLA